MSESAEVYICKHPKARKDHKCCECGGTILKGETYNKHSGIWEDRPNSFKVCTDCDKLREKIGLENLRGDDQVYFEELHEFVFNGEDVEDMRAFLKIKEKRRAKIEKWMVDTFDELFDKEEND